MSANKQIVRRPKEDNQQVSAPQAQQLRRVEEHEYEAGVAAQAGFSLSTSGITGALAGVFAGRRRKVTQKASDGTSLGLEQVQEAGWVKGTGTGTPDVVGHAVKETHRLTAEKGEVRQQSLERVDHLGIEDREE